VGFALRLPYAQPTRSAADWTIPELGAGVAVGKHAQPTVSGNRPALTQNSWKHRLNQATAQFHRPSRRGKRFGRRSLARPSSRAMVVFAGGATYASK
jgi:hypothetical protein